LPVFYLGRQDDQARGVPMAFLDELEEWQRAARNGR
jgi:hypothetical protein